MHCDDAVLKLKSNESNLSKKKGRFLDYFFFLSIVEAGAFAFATPWGRLLRNPMSIQITPKKNLKLFFLIVKSNV